MGDRGDVENLVRVLQERFSPIAPADEYGWNSGQHVRGVAAILSLKSYQGIPISSAAALLETLQIKERPS